MWHIKTTSTQIASSQRQIHTVHSRDKKKNSSYGVCFQMLPWFHVEFRQLFFPRCSCSFCLLLFSAFRPVFCPFSRQFGKPVFFLEIDFFVWRLLVVGGYSGWEMISWSVVSEARHLRALVLAMRVLRYASFLIGQRRQHVLALLLPQGQYRTPNFRFVCQFFVYYCIC